MTAAFIGVPVPEARILPPRRIRSDVSPPNPVPYYVAGAQWSIGATVSVTPGSDEIFAFPFFSGPGGILDAMAIDVTASAAGGLARTAIYEPGPSPLFYPQRLIAGTTIEHSLAAVGVSAFTLPTAARLAAEQVYWFAFQRNAVGAPTVHGMADPMAFFGVSGQSDFNARNIGWNRVALYASGLPDPFPSGADFTASHIAVAARWQSDQP
jgi:hypothetical protein